LFAKVTNMGPFLSAIKYNFLYLKLFISKYKIKNYSKSYNLEYKYIIDYTI